MMGYGVVAAEDRDIEAYLHVGTTVAFHSNPFRKDAPRYKTVARGWHKPVYIILDRPKMEGRFVVMHENQPCVIRFLSEGYACAFDTIVLDWDTRKHNAYFRIAWPQTLKTVAFRKHERMKAQLPCKLSVRGAECDGFVSDLSIGGCCVKAGPVAFPGDEIELTFKLPDGSLLERVRAAVRNARPAGDDMLVGCQFIEDQGNVQSDIAFYVNARLDREKQPRSDVQRILIIDQDPKTSRVLRKCFEERGYEVFAAPGVIDGLFRLRMAPPDALLVNQELADLAGIEVARIVRRTSGFESLPLFIYGGRTPGLESEARDVGATNYFPADHRMDQIVDVVVFSGIEKEGRTDPQT